MRSGMSLVRVNTCLNCPSRPRGGWLLVSQTNPSHEHFVRGAGSQDLASRDKQLLKKLCTSKQLNRSLRQQHFFNGQPQLLTEERRTTMYDGLKYRWHLAIVSSVSSSHISAYSTGKQALLTWEHSKPPLIKHHDKIVQTSVSDSLFATTSKKSPKKQPGMPF